MDVGADFCVFVAIAKVDDHVIHNEAQGRGKARQLLQESQAAISNLCTRGVVAGVRARGQAHGKIAMFSHHGAHLRSTWA